MGDARAPLVTTANGTVAGITKKGVAGFLGVPFAAPPTGTLRFRETTAHAGWPGILAAATAAPLCVQGASPGHGSEDCLYLNAFAPLAGLPGAASPKAPRPILFYIHGGGFVGGGAREAFRLGARRCSAVSTTRVRRHVKPH